MEKIFNSYVMLCQFKFWQNDSGSCMVIQKALNSFPAKKKQLVLTFKVKKELAEDLKKKYGLEEVVCLVPTKTIIIRFIRSVFYRLHLRTPYSLLRPFKVSNHTQNRFLQLCRKYQADAVQVEYLWYSDIAAKVLREKSIVTSLETHDVQSQFTANIMATDDRTKSLVTPEDEYMILDKFDAVLAVSTSDYSFLKGQLKTHVYYVPPLSVNDDYQPLEKNKHKGLHLCFIAGFSNFNFSSITWFIDNVFLKLKTGDYILNVYGKICDSLQEKYSKVPNIHLNGYVSKISDVYAENDMAVNSTFQTGGIKAKNLEALYYATPILTTTLGIRGLEKTVDTKAAFVCDKPEDYLKVLEDFACHPEKIKESSKAAFDYIKDFYSDENYESYYQSLAEIARNKNDN
jgi:hypothetical protein